MAQIRLQFPNNANATTLQNSLLKFQLSIDNNNWKLRQTAAHQIPKL